MTLARPAHIALARPLVGATAGFQSGAPGGFPPPVEPGVDGGSAARGSGTPRRRLLGALAALVLVLGLAAPEARDAAAIHAGAGPPLAIAPEDLARYREAGEAVTVIDLRPAAAFRQGHVPRAVSLPLPELRARQAEVPRAGRVVLYGGSATEAATAYQALRDAGHRNVMVLAGGLAAWTAAGLPLETAP